MVPTKHRNVQSVFLKYKTHGILFDCGEGTQRQMNIAGIKRTEVTKIFLSHWHGDHVSGIIGLLQTLSNSESRHKIEIYGPKETKKKVGYLFKAVRFDAAIELKITDVDAKKIKKISEDDDYVIEAVNVEHGIPCLGYSFTEKDRWRINISYLKEMGVPEGPHLQLLQKGKNMIYKGKEIEAKKAASLVRGKKITIIPDTGMCQNAVDLAYGADVLICEATFASKHTEKSEKYRHLTAAQAAMIANQANVEKLYLTHFSQRYENTQEIEEDARAYFNNIVCAYDFMKIVL